MTVAPTDRAEVGRELDAIRNDLGLSERSLAEKLGVDRNTLKRVFAGDPTVRQSKWRSIELRIRALLDGEPESSGPTESRVEVRATIPSGYTVSVSGPVSDLEAMEATLLRLLDGIVSPDA